MICPAIIFIVRHKSRNNISVFQIKVTLHFVLGCLCIDIDNSILAFTKKALKFK